MYNMNVFLTERIKICLYSLSRIQNTSLIDAFFGIDCECLENLFIVITRDLLKGLSFE
jgi:hypothetical protein